MHTSIRMLLLMIVVLALAGCAQTAASEKHEAAKTEPIEGTSLKRVILTEKAAERLGIETVPVRSEQVVRKHWLGGQVVAVPANEVRVRVKLSQLDLARLDRSQSVVVKRVGSDDQAGDLKAEPDMNPDGAAVGDSKDGANALYYKLTTTDHGLVPGQPVFVEMANASGSAERKIVPFAALIYGLEGETWVYTQSAPLAYVRHAAAVDYIQGDQAFLLEGPPTETAVVTVGGAELFGVESGIGGGH